MKKALGTHILVEMYGCNPGSLKDKNWIEELMRRAAIESKAKIVKTFFHQFKPFGVSGVVVIEESHFTIHTWPEHKFAAIDFFYCSNEVKIEKAVDVLQNGFKPENVSMVEIKRGILGSVEEDEIKEVAAH
ncbi:MAG: adenosylmethionine decarboxylase [Acidobacteriota bacterium]